MADLSTAASRMIDLRLGDLVSIRRPDATAKVVQACRQVPSAASLAALAWDFVEDALALSVPNHQLPRPASEASLQKLRAAALHRFACEPPSILLELLARHDGVARTDTGTAFYACDDIIEAMAWLEDIDSSLMPISGDLAGNHAVVRLGSNLADSGVVYGFWHEDFADSGLEPMARNVGEYLMLAHQHVVETLTEMYRGPVSFA